MVLMVCENSCISLQKFSTVPPFLTGTDSVFQCNSGCAKTYVPLSGTARNLVQTSKPLT